MNLKSLHKGAVRNAGRVEMLSGLGGAELAAVTAAASFNIVGQDTPVKPQPQPSTPVVTPEQCAIHFYYPTDVAL